MKRLTSKFFIPTAALMIAFLNVGCSSTQVNDAPVSKDDEAGKVMTNTSPADSSSMNTSDSAPMDGNSGMASMHDDSGMKTDMESETDHEMMEGNSEAAMSSTPEIQYTCKHDSAVRTIKVFYDVSEGLACEVTYEKSTGTQTLWTAINDKDFCDTKAMQFAEKQVGWGWQCEDMNGTVVTLSEPEVETEPEPEVVAEPEAVSESNLVTESADVAEPETTQEPEATPSTEEVTEPSMESSE